MNKGLCAPVNGSQVCPPCGEGRVCNAQIGECVAAGRPAMYAGEGAAGDGECVERDGRQVCLSPCGENDSCNGESCVQGYCEPTSIGCDPCEGRYDQRQPICIEETGQCGECDVNNPTDGSTCGSNNRCGEPVNRPVSSMVTAGCDGLPFCVEGLVGCLQQTDCPRDSVVTRQLFVCQRPLCWYRQAGTSWMLSGQCLKPDGSLGCNSPVDCAADHSCPASTMPCPRRLWCLLTARRFCVPLVYMCP